MALGNATLDGSVLFAKNSDRESNEAHQIEFVPAADHEAVKCCRVLIFPSSSTAHVCVLLAKPFWIWGAEMGGNEHGVSLGMKLFHEGSLREDPL